jgi:hypothetical protein
MDFEQFKNLNLSEIEKWKHMKLTSEDIAKWKAEGSLIDKIYELKMKKLYLEYLKIKVQNIESAVDPFINYDPIKEAEYIISKMV